MKNKKLTAVTGLTAVAIIGGSLAYFNQTMEVENPFATNKYASELIETFTPTEGDNWEPGSEVNKDIEVKNTGDYAIITRIKFDETWTRKNENAPYIEGNGLKDEASQLNPNDGLTHGDYSVVKKNLDTTNENKWFYNEDDKYYYFLETVEKGASTGKFLDSVTLIENADMGVYETVKYYTTAENVENVTGIGTDPSIEWVVYRDEMPIDAKHTKTVTQLVNSKEGYADSNYKLTVTAQTVQATEEAVKSAFGLSDFSSITGNTWFK